MPTFCKYLAATSTALRGLVRDQEVSIFLVLSDTCLRVSVVQTQLSGESATFSIFIVMVPQAGSRERARVVATRVAATAKVAAAMLQRLLTEPSRFWTSTSLELMDIECARKSSMCGKG